jgi:hypothetical protein
LKDLFPVAVRLPKTSTWPVKDPALKTPRPNTPKPLLVPLTPMKLGLSPLTPKTVPMPTTPEPLLLMFDLRTRLFGPLLAG